jgi:predicted RNase H-like HicB family nuclease
MPQTSIGYFELTLTVTLEGDQYSAICEELGTATYADTLQAAVSELRELISLHLAGLEEEGIAEEFFHENGIEILAMPPISTERKIHLGGGTFPEIIPWKMPVNYPGNRTAQYA